MWYWVIHLIVADCIFLRVNILHILDDECLDSFPCFITADCTVRNVLIVWICGNFPRAFILNRNYCIRGKFILIVAKYYPR